MTNYYVEGASVCDMCGSDDSLIVTKRCGVLCGKCYWSLDWLDISHPMLDLSELDIHDLVENLQRKCQSG